MLHGRAAETPRIDELLTSLLETCLATLKAAAESRRREADLALVGYFQPVPDEVLAAYREILPVHPAFPVRQELWRLAAYLAVVAVAGDGPIGRQCLDRLAGAVRRYR